MPEFRSLGHSGSDLLTLSSSGFDPTATSSGEAPGKINVLLVQRRPRRDTLRAVILKVR